MTAPRAAPPLAVLTLRDRGYGIRAIARILAVSRNAVRRALRESRPEAGTEGPALEVPPSKRRSKLDAHREKVVQLLTKYPALSLRRILEEIRKDGYEGGETILGNLLRKVRPKVPVEAYDRIETDPGIEGQVDWSPFDVEIGGRVERVNCLAVTLCWSRILFVAFFRRCDQSSLLAGLVLSFEYVGGVCVRYVFDNPPSIVAIRLGPAYIFQERLRSLARHYGAKLRAARVRHPKDKPKVERPFQDIFRDFLYGRTFGSLEDLNRRALEWLKGWNGRKHGTTLEIPWERLEEERKVLLPLPAHRYDVRVAIPVVVAADFTVAFDGVRYSAPPRFVGERAIVRADEAKVEILCGGEVVAQHQRSGAKGTRIVLPEHRAELKLLKREARRAALESRTGPNAAADPDGYDQGSREILGYGNDGEAYLAALVATYRGGARHELRKTLELRDRIGDPAFRMALTRSAEYGAAGSRVLESIAEDLIRRGVVERKRPQPSSTSPSPALSPEVPIRSELSYLEQALGDTENLHESRDRRHQALPAGAPPEPLCVDPRERAIVGDQGTAELLGVPCPADGEGAGPAPGEVS